jgi:diacylglycerol kinase (ATP)
MSKWNHGASGLIRIVKALGYSLSGLRAAFTSEAAFRQELLLAVILIPLAFYLHVSHTDRALMIGSVLLVLVIELLNAAIEAVVDRASPEWHELAKRAKDMGSAAVFLALINAAVIWALVLWE